VTTIAASVTTEMIISCNPRTLPRAIENSFTVNNKAVGPANADASHLGLGGLNERQKCIY
jgi:hypothetical protein